MDNPFSLKNKSVLVTGASSGIGRGIAIACAGMGANVILTARNESRLKETLSMLEGAGHSYICADINDAGQRSALISSLPLLDGFVQCAGVMNRVPCKAVEQEDIDSVFSTNVSAPILLQAELLQEKKLKKESSIVYIASISARYAVAGNALYSASKSALISYAKCLAQEVANRQIRVNCVCPAMVWTDIAHVGATKEELEFDQSKYPLKRYGTPQDIANLSVYLLSDASSWMTGSCIDITGGYAN